MVPTCPPSSIYHRFLTLPTSIFAIPYNVFHGFSIFQQIVSKTLPKLQNAPKRLPRTSQDPSKRPQERSKRPSDESSSPQDHPSDAQKSPKRLQEAFTRFLRAPKCLPGDLQSAHSEQPIWLASVSAAPNTFFAMPPITPHEFHELCFTIVTFIVGKMLSLLYALNGLIEENKHLRSQLYALQRPRPPHGGGDSDSDGGPRGGKGGGKGSKGAAPTTPDG